MLLLWMKNKKFYDLHQKNSECRNAKNVSKILHIINYFYAELLKLSIDHTVKRCSADNFHFNFHTDWISLRVLSTSSSPPSGPIRVLAGAAP